MVLLISLLFLSSGVTICLVIRAVLSLVFTTWSFVFVLFSLVISGVVDISRVGWVGVFWLWVSVRWCSRCFILFRVFIRWRWTKVSGRVRLIVAWRVGRVF